MTEESTKGFQVKLELPVKLIRFTFSIFSRIPYIVRIPKVGVSFLSKTLPLDWDSKEQSALKRPDFCQAPPRTLFHQLLLCDWFNIGQKVMPKSHYFEINLRNKNQARRRRWREIRLWYGTPWFYWNIWWVQWKCYTNNKVVSPHYHSLRLFVQSTLFFRSSDTGTAGLRKLIMLLFN